MTHRRAFLRGAATALTAGAVAHFLRIDEALAETRGALARDLRGVTPVSDALAARLREEYLLAPDVTYLNHASIGTVPRAVHEAHKAYLSICETNPWLYMWGGVWEAPREAVRGAAARALRCAAEDVAITHNTTEGFNLLAQGLPLGAGDEVLFSSINHDGASVCFRHHAETRGYRVRVFRFPVERAPELTADDLVALHLEQVRSETRLLVFPHVDNVVGLRLPIAELAAGAHAAGVEFVAADGAQTVGALPLDLPSSGIDFYAASPHKWVQSPKGLGLFYARADARTALRPMWVTWGQSRWAETSRRFEDYGTRNLPAVLALGDALEFQESIGYGAKAARHRHLIELVRGLAESTPGFGWASTRRAALSGPLCSVSIEGLPAPELSSRLLERGYVFRPFHTEALNAARLSPNLVTSEAEIRGFFDEGSRILSDA